MPAKALDVSLVLKIAKHYSRQQLSKAGLLASAPELISRPCALS